MNTLIDKIKLPLTIVNSNDVNRGMENKILSDWVDVRDADGGVFCSFYMHSEEENLANANAFVDAYMAAIGGAA